MSGRCPQAYHSGITTHSFFVRSRACLRIRRRARTKTRRGSSCRSPPEAWVASSPKLAIPSFPRLLRDSCAPRLALDSRVRLECARAAKRQECVPSYGVQAYQARTPEHPHTRVTLLTRPRIVMLCIPDVRGCACSVRERRRWRPRGRSARWRARCAGARSTCAAAAWTWRSAGARCAGSAFSGCRCRAQDLQH